MKEIFLSMSRLYPRSEIRLWDCTPIDVAQVWPQPLSLQNCCEAVAKTKHGLVEKLVNSLDLGSSAERFVGSSPSEPTKFLKVSFENLKLFWCVRVIAEYVGDCGTRLRNSCVVVLGTCIARYESSSLLRPTKPGKYPYLHFFQN